MRIIFIYVFILMLLPIFSGAVLVDKPLNISIENCFSVSIDVELEEGSHSDIGFVGCKKLSSKEFSCNCLNKDNNNFSVIMRTDNTLIRNIRHYDLYISVEYFDVYRKTLSVDVEDGGDYYKEYQKDWREVTNKAKRFIKIEYVNNTVYKDRVVEVIKERIVYEDRIINNTVIEYVNITEYIENKTNIEILEERIKTKNSLLLIIIIGFSFLIIALSFLYWKKHYKKTND